MLMLFYYYYYYYSLQTCTLIISILILNVRCCAVLIYRYAYQHFARSSFIHLFRICFHTKYDSTVPSLFFFVIFFFTPFPCEISFCSAILTVIDFNCSALSSCSFNILYAPRFSLATFFNRLSCCFRNSSSS